MNSSGMKLKKKYICTSKFLKPKEFALLCLYNAFFRYYGQSKREKKKKVGIGVHDFLRICVTKFCVISKVGTKVSLKMDMATFVHIMNEAEQ